MWKSNVRPLCSLWSMPLWLFCFFCPLYQHQSDHWKMLININWLSHIVYSYVIYTFLWMLTYDSKTFMLCAHLCIFFFFSHASTMHHLFPIFFITILFRLQSGQSTHHCLCDHIYFLLRILCLLHSVEDQIHLPKPQWGRRRIYFTIVFQGHLHAKLYYSHSPLWAYIHLLRNPSIIKGEDFFFSSCIWSYWTTYGTTLCIMLRKENLCNFVTWCGGHMEYHLLM